MSISPARLAAFDILRRVIETNAYASELLHSARYANLSAQDHRLATELVMGVLRWQSWLDVQIAQRSSQKMSKLDPEVLLALRLGAYQLLFLDRVPERAAVNEAVELVKRARKQSAASFVNAVLRKFTKAIKRDKPEIGSARTSQELAEAAAHPLWLVEKWAREFGLENARRICEYDQRIPDTAVRLHGQGVQQELEQEGVKLSPGSLLSSARRVVSGDLIRTRAYREGQVTIQDEASQLVALLVGRGSKILDCCAAPGGKTRVLAERNPAALVVAAELHTRRAQLLRKRLLSNNVHVIAADARVLPMTRLFDRVLVDVSCSGTGTLAHNPEIKWRLTPDDLAELQARQLAVLQAAMQRVAPHGRLVYSTCSLEREENVEVVERALANDNSFRLVDTRGELDQLREQKELHWDDLASLTNGSYLQTLPGVHPCDGFFAAILEKS